MQSVTCSVKLNYQTVDHFVVFPTFHARFCTADLVKHAAASYCKKCHRPWTRPMFSQSVRHLTQCDSHKLSFSNSKERSYSFQNCDVILDVVCWHLLLLVRKFVLSEKWSPYIIGIALCSQRKAVCLLVCW